MLQQGSAAVKISSFISPMPGKMYVTIPKPLHTDIWNEKRMAPLKPPCTIGIFAKDLPINMIIRSSDDNDYIVGPSHEWLLFEKQACMVIVDPDGNGYKSVIRPRNVISDIEIKWDDEPPCEKPQYPPATHNYFLRPRARGRPRKHAEEEKPKRTPSHYNLYVKSHIQEYAEVPTQQRLKMVSKDWKLLKNAFQQWRTLSEKE
jgi:hypothetical protein